MKTTIKITLVMAFLLATCGAGLSASQLDIWTWRNPLPTGNQLNSVTYGNGLFVAVGANGAIVTSPDSVNWEQQTAPPNISLSGVAYSPDQNVFVAVGTDTATNNVILTSPGGTNWVQVTGLGTGGLLAVATDGSGDFMAVGNGGVTLYSSDGGVTWPQKNSGTSVNLNAVTCGNNEFAAVGDNSTILTWSSGSSWTPSTLTYLSGYTFSGASFSGIAYDNNNSTFVAVGDFFGSFFYSPDGGATFNQTTNITPSGSSFYGDSVIYVNNEFIVANTLTYYPSILTSSDGENWSAYSEPPWLFASIAYGSGIYVGVGAGSGTANGIAISLFGVASADDWNSVATSVTSGSLNAIAYGTTAAGTNLFVAGGSGNGQTPAVVTSTNGYNWQLDTDPSIDNEVLFYNAFITGLAYGTINGTPEFVATVNTSEGFSGYGGEIISSTNGIVWTTNYPSSLTLNGITYGQNGSQPLFVAVGRDDFIFSSSNLITWTSSSYPPSPSGSLNAVTYGNPNGTTTLVAVGGPGVILASTDGNANTWNPPSPALSGGPASATFSGVAYGAPNGAAPIFVAVGSGGTILTSPNGTVWTTRNSGTANDFSGVTFANGLFVAIAGSYSTGGAIFVSQNGIAWTQSSVATPDSLTAVASGDYQSIAVGGGGAILGSVLEVFPTGPGNTGFNGSGCFYFKVMGPPGTYGVYVSRNLTSWTPLQNVTFSSGPGGSIQTVTDCGGAPQAYYYLGPPQ